MSGNEEEMKKISSKRWEKAEEQPEEDEPPKLQGQRREEDEPSTEFESSDYSNNYEKRKLNKHRKLDSKKKPTDKNDSSEISRSHVSKRNSNSESSHRTPSSSHDNDTNGNNNNNGNTPGKSKTNTTTTATTTTSTPPVSPKRKRASTETSATTATTTGVTTETPTTTTAVEGNSKKKTKNLRSASPRRKQNRRGKLQKKIPSSEFSDDELSSSEEERLKLEALSFRDKIYKFLDDPSYNRFAAVYMGINFLAIILSTINFLVSTLPIYQGETNPVLDGIEVVVIAIFTFDYFARFGLTRIHRLKFALTFLNMIDLLAIIPFYISLFLQLDSSNIGALVVLRLLRLFRIFRILKMIKYSKQLPLVIRATKKSRAGFGLALFSMSLFVILWASAIYYAEIGSCYFDNSTLTWRYNSDNSATPFQSIPHSMWWAVVTMTTVGYGDAVPITPAGKVVASGAMICGILVLAFPLTILAGNFNGEYTEYIAEEEERKTKQLLKEFRKNPSQVVPPKKVVKLLWEELLNIKGAIDHAKEQVAAIDRSFGKFEVYVRTLHHQTKLELQKERDARRLKQLQKQQQQEQQEQDQEQEEGQEEGQKKEEEQEDEEEDEQVSSSGDEKKKQDEDSDEFVSTTRS